MKFHLTITFLLITPFLFAQVNLVPNYSFEDTTHCPTQQGEIFFAPPWNSVNAGTDYFNSCNNACFGVPYNCGGYEPAHTEMAYAGIWLFIVPVPTYRDYLQVPLLDSLKYGKKYYTEFYVSLADSCYYACNDIGIYFSKDSVISTNNDPLPYLPQIENSHSNPLTNKNGWTKISGYYYASGGERYIVIGNFKDAISSDTVYVGGLPSTLVDWRQAYYYVDDVTVRLDTTQGIEENNLCKIKLHPNPATNELTIDFALTDKGYFELFDLIGAKRKAVTLDKGSQTKRIDLTDIDSGIYFYSVVDRKGNRIKTGKLIVIK